jgi:hypothetical protein
MYVQQMKIKDAYQPLRPKSKDQLVRKDVNRLMDALLSKLRKLMLT